MAHMSICTPSKLVNQEAESHASRRLIPSRKPEGYTSQEVLSRISAMLDMQAYTHIWEFPKIRGPIMYLDPPTTLNWNLIVLIWWYLE